MTAEVPDYLVAGNTVKPNNIEFRLQGDNAPQEIIRLDSEGFHYRGQLIEDAGEAHQLMVEFLKQSTRSQTEPVAPTDEELEQLLFDNYRSAIEFACDTKAEGDIVVDNHIDFARAVLTRWGRPAIEPVPVAERLPEPEDCDGKGRCWIFDPGDHVSSPVWAFECSEEFQWLKTQDEDKVQQASQRGRLTWLPHYALPLLTREEN
jgi:hypothetical protein